MKDRIQSLDAIKAFAIFLVVFGHMLQKCVEDVDDNYLFKLIYSFHMPLFIFISGFVSYRKDGLKDKYLINKFIGLLIPYFSWILVLIFISSFNNTFDFKDKLIQYLLYPDNGLWFLWVLFWMQCVLYICFVVSKKHHILLLGLFFIIYFLVVFLSGIDNIFCVKTFAFLFPFFILGYISNKHIIIFKRIIFKWWLLLPLLLIMAYFWHRTEKINIPNIPLNPVLIAYLYKSIIGVIGIIVVFGLFSIFKNFNKMVLMIGKNTLPIYAMNFIFINWIGFVLIFFQNIILFYFVMLIITLLVIACSLTFDFYLKKSKILSLLFLGINFKQKQ
jgi:fucose 4-O-acetylase-like acetyltransferase